MIAAAPATDRSVSATGDARFGSTTRLQASTKSPARTGAPFDHFASGRSWKVYWVPDASTAHELATPGITEPSGPSEAKPSYRSRITSNEKISVAWPGSNEAGSPPIPRLSTVSLALCADSAVEPERESQP